MPAMTRARWVRYAVLGLAGVVLVLMLWSRMGAEAPPRAGSSPAAASPSGAASRADVVRTTATGDAYPAPTVRYRSSTLIVEQSIWARPASGRVEVARPVLQVLVDGAEAAPREDRDARTSIRTTGGSLVAFVAAFDAETVRGPVVDGDEVTVRVTAADGSTHDVTAVVRDAVRYAHRPR